MTHYDILIRNGTVIDGTGAPRRRADVGIRGKHIATVGATSGATAGRIIDASGRIVAPGFIDAHTHDDRYLLVAPEMTPKLSQGVTTVITGNCGLSLAPWLAPRNRPVPSPLDLLGDAADFCFDSFHAYLKALEAAPCAVNAACLIGHTTLRAAVMDRLDREATADEIVRMRALVEDALRAGAIGFSTGIGYPPAVRATTAEISAIAQPLGAFGAVYASHIRDEGEHIIDALDEACRIGAAGHAQLVVSHHKLSGVKNHGRSVETLGYLTKAMTRQPVGLDCYPYHAGSSMLRMSNVNRASRVIVTRSAMRPEFAGRDLDSIADELGQTIEETVRTLEPAGAIYFMMDEDDVQRILAFSHTMIGSDGLPHDTAPHPRLWGTFPRVLGHYCRDVGLFPLEIAVHKMTGLTASTFKLPGRGVLAKGMYADVAVFDAETVADTATWLAPTNRARGIETVIVNGELAWQDQAATGAACGSVIRLSDRLAV